MLKNTIRSIKHILPGIIGGITFLLFSFAVNLNMILSLGMGIISYIAGHLLFLKSRGKKNEKYTGFTDDFINKSLREAYKKLKVLNSYHKKIKKISAKQKLEKICITIERILENLKKDPKDIRVARKFLTLYLDSTIDIVSKYEDLSSRKVQSAEIKTTLERAEKVMGVINESFAKQLVKLLEDDVMSLDTEIQVLEKTLKLEGL